MSKRFPGLLALDEVDLSLYQGEVHALTGENGSGKSTLAKILQGIEQPTAGIIEIDGRPVEISTPARALGFGIVGITQELTLAPSLSVTANILMGRLPRRRSGVIDWTLARRMARSALDALEVNVSEDAIVSELSTELRQEVEIVRAVSARSRVLILDEATSSLSEEAAKRLLALVDRLKQAQVAILMISHRMSELYALATRATVLRDGRVVDVVPLPDTEQSELVRMMIGRKVGDLYSKRSIAKGSAVLVVRDLASRDGKLRAATFDVRAGEIVGVAGLVGSGKAQIGECLAGATRSHGHVSVRGETANLSTPYMALKSGIGLVPDDRGHAAILPTRSVRQNLSIAWTRSLSRGGVIASRLEHRMVTDAMRRFGVRAQSPNTPIVALSGGNQQKVILARWFALGLDVLVLAEPTRGIDIGAKGEIYNMIQAQAERGAAIVMISSEIPELIGISDRILVTFHGAIAGTFEQSDFDEEAIAHVAMSGGAHAHRDARSASHELH